MQDVPASVGGILVRENVLVSCLTVEWKYIKHTLQSH